ncbi:MAG TPA: GNAT family N-acetyltransferase [Pyrinomonadaceae bacterium]|nr:GNAT family N-acetyltransferase [Pyrinomonadaceae bacterium]
MTNIIIRDIEGQRELRAVEELQKKVWGIPDLDVVPLTQLVAAQAAGGVLLGAFDGDNLVGFVYGFVGYEHGRMTHHSHMLAVRLDYRNFNLGQKLKMAQRARALSQGINLMTWTFDPLQSLNAYFNFSKLGVFSDRYLINFYGEDAASFLHQTGTDRLWVTWDLASSHFQKKVDEKKLKENFGQITPLVKVGVDEFPLSGDLDEELKGEHALIEIPGNINDLVKRNDGSAQKWRESTRRAFTEAIKRGFLVENFHRTNRGDQKFGVYSLSRRKIEDRE